MSQLFGMMGDGISTGDAPPREDVSAPRLGGAAEVRIPQYSIWQT